MKKSILSRLVFPIFIFVVLLVITLLWKDIFFPLSAKFFGQLSKIIGYGVSISFWIAGAWLLSAFFKTVICDFLLEKRIGFAVPKLIKDVVTLILYFVAILAIIGLVFEQSITGLLTASGVVGLVVGLAVRNTIADIFSGVTLSLDHPYKINDWVYLHSQKETVKVAEITWRSTRFKRPDNSVLIIPNSKLTSMAITNNSVHPIISYSFTVLLDISVPRERVEILLVSAAKTVPEILQDPAPSVLISKISNEGVAYDLSYWVETQKTSASKVKHTLIANILNQLHQAGVEISQPLEIKNYARQTKRDFTKLPSPEVFIDRIPLFYEFNKLEKATLANKLLLRHKKKGEAVITLGESGESMFIVVEGLAAVLIKIKDHPDLVKAAHLTSGQFFGEMSLFTGEPRSATITAETDLALFEITKPIMQEMLHNRPELISTISQTIADRKAEDLAKEEQILSEEEKAHAKVGLVSQIVGKIKHFFGLKT